MLIDGVILSVVGGAAAAVGATAAGGLLSGLGFLGAFLGFLVLLIAIAMFIAPQYHSGLGIGILILSLLSIFGGGGFILGVILGVIAGILGIVFDDSVNETSLPSSEYAHRLPSGDRWAPAPSTDVPSRPPTPVARPGATSPGNRVGTSPETGPKTCPRCSARFESFRMFCPQCGAPAPPAA